MAKGGYGGSKGRAKYSGTKSRVGPTPKMTWPVRGLSSSTSTNRGNSQSKHGLKTYGKK